MSSPSDPSRVAKVERFLHHLGRRDLTETLELLSPHVTYRVPGDHTLAGDFSGRDEVARHLLAIAERTGGHFDPFKQDDLMVGVNHVAVLVDVRMQSQTATARTRVLILLRFDGDDLIDTVTMYSDDVAAVERFFGRVAGEATGA